MIARRSRLPARFYNSVLFLIIALCALAASSTVSAQLPMEPARTINLELQEGTWVSIDVSPDGSTIVFDLLGDLYLLPSTGGTATPLTYGMAFDAQPRFSPDGQSILFVSDRSGDSNVWVMNVDGTALRQITRERHMRFSSPTYAPDGKSIVVSKVHGVSWPVRQYRLCTYSLSDNNGKALIPDEVRGDGGQIQLGAQVSPDGRFVYFNSYFGVSSVIRSAEWRILKYDQAKKEITKVEYGPLSALRPSLSPNGKTLVYAQRRPEHTNLIRRDLNTSEETILAEVNQFEENTYGSFERDVYPNMVVTPDNHVVGAWEGKLWRISLQSGEIKEIPFSANAKIELGPLMRNKTRITDEPITARNIMTPALSPNGDKVVFSSLNRIWIADLAPAKEQDGKSGDLHATIVPRRVTSSDIGEFFPTWSPDGAFIAYTTWSEKDGGHVMRIRADGSAEPEQLTQQPAYYRSPAYSPDGGRIVVVRKDAEHRRRDVQISFASLGGANTIGHELHWLDANGGITTPISHVTHRGRPQFINGDNRIYYYPYPYVGFARALPRRLISMQWDGGDFHEHAEVLGYSWPHDDTPAKASEVLLSPDGKSLLAASENHVFRFSSNAQKPPWLVSDTLEPLLVNGQSDHLLKVTSTRLDKLGGHHIGWGKDSETIIYALGPSLFLQTANYTREYRIDIQHPRDKPSGVIALTGARIITMRGNEVIRKGDIVIEDNRILAIGKHGRVTIPKGARRINVSGATIIPGLVEAHGHHTMPDEASNGQPWQLNAMLAYGVTTNFDPAAESSYTLYNDMVAAGLMTGPRLFDTGLKIEEHENVQSLDEARALVRRYHDYYGLKYLKEYHSGNREQRQWLLMAADEFEMTTTTEAGHGLTRDLENLFDGHAGFEHAMPVVPIYQDVIQLFKKSGVTHTPTLSLSARNLLRLFTDPEDLYEDQKLVRHIPEYNLRRLGYLFSYDPYLEKKNLLMSEAAGALINNGARVTVGSHGEIIGLGTHLEMWMLEKGGISQHQALRAATLSGAESLGLSDDLGSLEQGKLADLIVLNGNPLTDIRKSQDIRWVMKNGRLYDGVTLAEF